MTLDDVKVAYVSAIKRQSGQPVIAFADNTEARKSTTLFWREGSEEMRTSYLPVRPSKIHYPPVHIVKQEILTRAAKFKRTPGCKLFHSAASSR